MNPYRESQGVVLWGRTLIVVAIVALLGTLIYGFMSPGDKPSWVLWPMTLLLALIAINFWQMRLTIDNEALIVGFGIIKKRIHLSEIVSWEPTAYSWVKYGGWGIRFARDGSRAYSARGRQGVAVHTQKRTYVITSDDPEQLARAISQFVGGRHAS
ncbi:MAG: hypothetical protein ACE5IA_03190 [Dehalococcoidia bacterium]